MTAKPNKLHRTLKRYGYSIFLTGISVQLVPLYAILYWSNKASIWMVVISATAMAYATVELAKAIHQRS